MNNISQETGWLLKEKYKGKKSEAFFNDCKRLIEGEPLAYIIGHIPFLHCKIWLDSKPLIPRVETEFWTNEAIKVIKQSTAPSLGLGTETPKILDLCSGSGCIGVAVAKAIPEAYVDFSEIDKSHIPTITKNLKENSIPENNTSIYNTNLLTNLPKKYNYILSNPPYVDASLNRISESVVKHEPLLALYGGKHGLEIIERIINTAPQNLSPTGQLWIEHEPEQTQAIKNLAIKNNFSVYTNQDQFNVDRYSILMLQ